MSNGYYLGSKRGGPIRRPNQESERYYHAVCNIYRLWARGFLIFLRKSVHSSNGVTLGRCLPLIFQALRPRWTGLYAARKRRRTGASRLPELPGDFFGWMPVLYRISEDEVLASAGLDAFVVSIPTRLFAKLR